MEHFTFTTASTPSDAITVASRANTAQLNADIRFIAGGTNLVDLMKLNVEHPHQLVDINNLPLDEITLTPSGLTLGALSRNGDVAHHPEVQQRFPVLSQALLSGASPQLRNMATTAGNLLQRTRCVYFRDTVHRCNKRAPGSGCDAMDGYHRNLAILGTSDHCIASNPSDQNVALTALEATIHITGPKGERTVPIASFYKLPGTTPHIETVLEPGDLITHVTVPAVPATAKQAYLKLRDRASYEFALASTAAIASTQGGRITHVRLALGGVGAIPWRAHEAEHFLEGKAPTAENFRHAADLVFATAKPRPGNAFKAELAKRCMVRTLTQVTT